jgi:alkylated DNA repair protein alkB homolog 7
VIHNYRETHLSAWPTSHPQFGSLSSILPRLYALCPCPQAETQTHLLHLASDGEILPHVDNVDASGSWILGVSLGAQRVLRMENGGSNGEGEDKIEVVLDSGSVYLQR